MCMAETTDGALLAAQYTVVSSGSEQDLALYPGYIRRIRASKAVPTVPQYVSTSTKYAAVCTGH